MPIPDFNINGVLPPYLGSPTDSREMSPYHSTSLEVCKRFATNENRVDILERWLVFRKKMSDGGMTVGVQWVNGSFVEDIEMIDPNRPGDMDVTTFFWSFNPTNGPVFMGMLPEASNPSEVKRKYRLDHQFMDLDKGAEFALESIPFWSSLFSHTREGVRKGYLRVELNTPDIDLEAQLFLENWRQTEEGA